ncbi:MAG: NADH-quinone oxidoreductase subunit C [Puia sp.]|nr:NADH-quinone oxidoreductase subunit C [Puia sp.]
MADEEMNAKGEGLKVKIGEWLPLAQWEEGPEWTTLLVEPASWPEAAKLLRFTPGLDFDFLFCLTCIDWKTHFTMVYHFRSTLHGHELVVKSKLDHNQPAIETVSRIWRTAEFHEREAYDLFGVNFLHHPDLRRLFLTDEWVGYPLRKDYEDPVNMIKL